MRSVVMPPGRTRAAPLSSPLAGEVALKGPEGAWCYYAAFLMSPSDTFHFVRMFAYVPSLLI